MVLVAWGARLFAGPGERSWWEGRSEGQGYDGAGQGAAGPGGILCHSDSGSCGSAAALSHLVWLSRALPKEPASQAQFSC